MFRTAYKPGDRVPEQGIFWVHHFQHRLAHPVEIAGEAFPSCRTCGERVRFEKATIRPRSSAEPIGNDVDFSEQHRGGERQCAA
jgi:hypothetical protein